jgi:hypothetical protein
VEGIVVRNEKAFELLRQIIRKPYFDFHINYDSGVADLRFTNLDLVESKHSAERLRSAFECTLHQGDSGMATTNLEAIIALVKAMQDERLVITELVRIAIDQIALNANWELLQSTNLLDAQLAALQEDWTSLEFVHAGERAVAMERVTGEISLARWRSADSELQKYFELYAEARASMGIPDHVKSGFDKLKDKGEFFLWRYWWSYPDELRYLKGLETLSETFRSASERGDFHDALSSQKAALDQLSISNLDNSFDSLFSGQNDFHSMLSQSVVALVGFPRTVMRAETAREMVISAIALKRYQLKHGNYPSNLESLVPEFIARVPLDPVDGNPLRYRLNLDGSFTLYSVGENGKDDGGNPSLEKGVISSSYFWENPHALDWVWPQPATAAEIENYYKNLSKGSN